MSLSTEETDKLTRLSSTNWTKWIEQVKDYILALDHDDAPDIWRAYIWKPEQQEDEGDAEDDPADKDYQDARNPSAKKLRVQHNKAFKYIRKGLTDSFFQTTIGFETNVPKLLRHLRDQWNDGTTSDKARLREEFRI